MKGNRPFFGKLVYQDVGGNLIQLLPNPYRRDHHFNGGSVYEVATGVDRFVLQVCPPFGTEKLILYAGTSPLREVKTQAAGGVYAIQAQTEDLGRNVRSIQILPVDGKSKFAGAAEFTEANWPIITHAK